MYSKRVHVRHRHHVRNVRTSGPLAQPGAAQTPLYALSRWHVSCLESTHADKTSPLSYEASLRTLACLSRPRRWLRATGSRHSHFEHNCKRSASFQHYLAGGPSRPRGHATAARGRRGRPAAEASWSWHWRPDRRRDAGSLWRWRGRASDGRNDASCPWRWHWRPSDRRRVRHARRRHPDLRRWRR